MGRSQSATFGPYYLRQRRTGDDAPKASPSLMRCDTLSGRCPTPCTRVEGGNQKPCKGRFLLLGGYDDCAVPRRGWKAAPVRSDTRRHHGAEKRGDIVRATCRHCRVFRRCHCGQGSFRNHNELESGCGKNVWLFEQRNGRNAGECVYKQTGKDRYFGGAACQSRRLRNEAGGSQNERSIPDLSIEI